MYCKSCGAVLKDGAKFCPDCGAHVTEQQEAPQYQTPPAQQATPQYQALPAQQVTPQYQTPPAQQAAPQYQTPPAQQATPQYQTPPAQQAAPQYQTPPVQQAAPQHQYQPTYGSPSAKKKLSKGMRALVIILPIVIVLAAGGFLAYYLLSDRDDTTKEPEVSETAPTPSVSVTTSPTGSVSPSAPEVEEDIVLPYVHYSFLDKAPEAVIEFSNVESIFPSNYRTMDYLVTFTGYSDYGELDVLIEVEVPGFTQPYRQKVSLGRQVTKLRIMPPLVTGTIDLNTEKVAQLIYSVTEVDTGKLLVQESRNLKLYSKFDMIWGEPDDWRCFTDNILAWMTPDAPEILQLKRDAIDYLEYISDGELTGLLGYQNYNFFDHYYYNTWIQAVAIQGAMSDITGVRYNNSLFSMDAQQRVKLPADTLNSRSGLCIETALVMASALQSTGMHVMLIFPPGHAQVAVEAWTGAGDYFLIETTILPMARDMDAWDYTVRYLDRDEWLGYITGEGNFTYGPCYILDCELGEKLGIRAMSN